MSYSLFISHNILLSSRCNDSNHASFSSLILRYALPFGLHQDIYKLYSLSLFLIINVLAEKLIKNVTMFQSEKTCLNNW